MGVLGLWDILAEVGHPLKVDALEGKKLGVDANIWLYKFIRGFRDKDNGATTDSHKVGLFARVSKLLFYKIKPVFVFDGPAPILKRKTLERRQDTRNKQLIKQQDTAVKILKEQLKEQYPNLDLDKMEIKLPELTSNYLAAAEKMTDEDRNLYYIPPIREEEKCKLKTEDDEEDDDDEDQVEIDFSGRLQDQTDIDIESEDFAKLPAEVRYELLKDIKESRRRIKRLGNLPEDANSFSNLQLERLRARRSIQEKIEQCERDICMMYTGEMDSKSVQYYRVQSDAKSSMIYVKNNPNQSASSNPEAGETSKIEESKTVTEPAEPEPDLNESIKRPKLSSDELKATEKMIDEDLYYIPQTTETDEHNLTDREDDSAGNEQGTSDDIRPIDKTIEIDSDDSSDSAAEVVCELSSSAESDSSMISVEDIQITPERIDLNEENDQVVAKSPSNIRLCDKTIEIDSDDSSSVSPTKVVQELSKDHEDLQSELSKSSIDSVDGNQESETITKTIEMQRTQADNQQASRVNHPRAQNIDIHSDDAQEAPIEAPSKPSRVVAEPVTNSRSAMFHVEDSQSRQSNSSKATDRQTNRVTAKIIEEAKELLRLFGVPYIDAAGEAEAQCALLEELKLTEGTITDDSDIWLFGSHNVYRHFFSEDKWLMHYKMKDIEYHIRMNRENLICFAMLVGSDYTDGIMKVGPVTAIEVLSEFPGNGIDPLVKFKEWKDKYEKTRGERVPGSRTREKLLKYRLPADFPSRVVYDGYLKPQADHSTERFQWGMPDLDGLREYSRRNFGWNDKKIDDKLLPIMKRLNERQTQSTIDSYFFKTPANENPDLFRSKRVNEALRKIADKRAETAAASASAKSKGAAKPPAGEVDVVCLTDTEPDEQEDSETEQDKTSRNKTKGKKTKRGSTKKQQAATSKTTTAAKRPTTKRRPGSRRK